MVKIFRRNLGNTLKQLTRSYIKCKKILETDVLLEVESEMTRFLGAVVDIVGRTRTLREAPNTREMAKDFSKPRSFLSPGYPSDSLISRRLAP